MIWLGKVAMWRSTGGTMMRHAETRGDCDYRPEVRRLLADVGRLEEADRSFREAAAAFWRGRYSQACRRRTFALDDRGMFAGVAGDVRCMSTRATTSPLHCRNAEAEAGVIVLVSSVGALAYRITLCTDGEGAILNSPLPSAGRGGR